MKVKNLSELDPKLRRRILDQVARDDAKAAGIRRANNHRREVAAEVGQEPARPLAQGARASGKGGAGCGQRYRVEFTLYSCQPADWDNCAGSVKEIQDQLVRQGWLPDGDGWRELEGTAKAVKVAHKNEQRVEARLTRIA